MKKTLSLILSLIMLLSITSGLSFNAFAESYIDEIELYHIDAPVAGESPNFMAATLQSVKSTQPHIKRVSHGLILRITPISVLLIRLISLSAATAIRYMLL